jgi:cytidine deaminase
MSPQRPIAELAPEWQPLVAAARAAMAKAYAPYSKFFVGSCLEDDNGRLWSGCNVENASYSAAICAERTAVVKMVSEGVTRLRRVVVITSSDEPCFPCGVCRQVLREFGSTAEVLAVNRQATAFRRSTLGELFPASFGPEQLDGAAP